MVCPWSVSYTHLLGLEGLKEYIKTIGLYNSKAENIIKTCRDLVEKHNGEVPESREALEALAGDVYKRQIYGCVQKD